MIPNSADGIRQPKTDRWRQLFEAGGVRECWPWKGSIHWEGYGAYNGRVAHRLVYEQLIGPVPPGLQLDHLCRNRRCVNPHHLEPVTARVNILRGDSPGARSVRRPTCANGHPRDEEHTYVWCGERFCRECNRLAVARRKARLRAAALRRVSRVQEACK